MLTGNDARYTVTRHLLLTLDSGVSIVTSYGLDGLGFESPQAPLHPVPTLQKELIQEGTEDRIVMAHPKVMVRGTPVQRPRTQNQW